MAIDDCVNSMTALRLERVRLMEHEKDLNRRWGETVDAFDRAYAQGQTTGDADRDFVLRAWREDNGALAGAWGRFREAMDAHVGEIFLLAVYIGNSVPAGNIIAASSGITARPWPRLGVNRRAWGRSRISTGLRASPYFFP